MKLLHANMQMVEVIHGNHLLIPVIARFGIRLGFGEATVAEVCKKHRIDPDFFVTILNVFSMEDYFPEKTLRAFDLLTITGYLKKTHSYYMETQVPAIERLISGLLRRSGRRNASLRIVKRFFLEYKRDLFAHLRREETLTFPYVQEVCLLFRHPKRRSRKGILHSYSMSQYEEEHNNVDEKINDLQNILLMYIKGEYDEDICNAIIFELFRLEKDIRDHTRIEDHIMKPMVAEMEKTLKLHTA